jgi:hypothetical protein
MCTHTYIRAHPLAPTHAHPRAPTRTHPRTSRAHHAHITRMSRACHRITPPTIPANGLRMAYNAFLTYGAWQCSATHKKWLKTALFQPVPQ